MGRILFFLFYTLMVGATKVFVSFEGAGVGNGEEEFQGTSIRTDGLYLRATIDERGINKSKVYMIHTDDWNQYQSYLEKWTMAQCGGNSEQCVTIGWKHSLMSEWTNPGFPCDLYLSSSGSCPLSRCVLWGKQGCRAR